MHRTARIAAVAAALGLSLGSVPAHGATATPIQNVVVIFQENVSFDHYFGTYPVAENLSGEPEFEAAPDTPSVNGLNAALLTNNPNGFNPFRLDRTQAATCDQDHGYTAEQQAFDFGLMDKFPLFTGFSASNCSSYGLGNDIVMGYFDGNTVTAIWNYAQNFAMNDNSFGTTFGPSAPGAINLISGQTAGAVPPNLNTAFGPDTVDGTLIDDAQPAGDVCTNRDNAAITTGKNVGDLLNAKGITWGWFQGGFDLTVTNPDGSTGCSRTHTSAITGVKKVDYIAHHEPFQYYASTANPNHTRPSSVAAIGTSSDGAKHQYDLNDFFEAASANNLPAVTFLKAAGFQDGHAQYSDPIDEQTFLVKTINFLQKLPQWNNMAIIISYDDSDGWYDHQMGPIVSQSNTPDDALTGNGMCGATPAGAAPGRCGYGPRLPLMVISPFAKTNFADHTVTDQTSIIRFIEDNWELGRIGGGSFDALAGSILNMFDFEHKGTHQLLLDPSTGEPLPGQGRDRGVGERG